jgi:glutamyl-tRNA reductase
MTAQSEVEGPTDSDLRRRLSTVREREFERAMRRLEASGDLSTTERRTLQRFSRRLVARLVVEPAIAAAAADQSERRATAESKTGAASTLTELFESSD